MPQPPHRHGQSGGEALQRRGPRRRQWEAELSSQPRPVLRTEALQEAPDHLRITQVGSGIRLHGALAIWLPTCLGTTRADGTSSLTAAAPSKTTINTQMVGKWTSVTWQGHSHILFLFCGKIVIALINAPGAPPPHSRPDRPGRADARRASRVRESGLVSAGADLRTEPVARPGRSDTAALRIVRFNPSRSPSRETHMANGTSLRGLLAEAYALPFKRWRQGGTGRRAGASLLFSVTSSRMRYAGRPLRMG